MSLRTYVEILSKLVAEPTLSSASNKRLVAYIEAFLLDLGFQCRRVPIDPGASKTNLLAWIGPDKPGGLMFAGHTDVVPVEGQSWTTNPFELSERGGRLVGRGTADMKGFLALVLAVCAQTDLSKLRRRLWLSFTYDEEVGCLGVRELLRLVDWAELGPRMVLIGEPTDGEVVSAHKGLEIFRTSIRGRPAHSSRPDLGTNAIAHALQLFSGIDAMLPQATDPRFSPPICTSNLGTIEGGSATNIIAEHCTVQWEVRPLPGTVGGEIERRWQERVGAYENPDGAQIETQRLAQVPAMQGNDSAMAVREMLAIMGRQKATTAPFVTEGGLYEHAGLKVVVCGPGELEQAHQPDESISLQRMDEFESVLRALLLKEFDDG